MTIPAPAMLKVNISALIDEMAKHWHQVSWKDSYNVKQHMHEAGLLKLNCDKALHHLHWQAVLSFRETVRMTAEWYRSYYENPTMIRDMTQSQIREYESHARKKKMIWAH